jgi:hypothetical protein
VAFQSAGQALFLLRLHQEIDMSLAVADESLKTLSVTAQLIPSNRPGSQGGICPSTLIRWITRGAKLRAGGRLRLKATRSPGGWLTSEAWIQEFLDALTADRSGSTEAADTPVRASARQQRESQRVDAGLRTAGIRV